MSGGRKWSVEEHPQAKRIIKELAAGRSQRSVAKQFDISNACVTRYVQAKLADTAAAALAKKDDEAGNLFIDSLLKRDEKIEKLYQACDEYLQDAEDPTKYDLHPRAWEIDVQYAETDEDGHKTYRKDSLQTIIDRMEGHDITPIQFKYHHADPRKLILETANTLRTTMELRARLAGKLIDQQSVTNVNVTLQSIKQVIVEATEGNPEVRDRIVEAIAGLG